MRQIRWLTPLFFSFFLVLACSKSPEPRTEQPQYAIASAHPLATQAGMEILANGGNAFDAAVAVAASLGVVEPYSAGLGGGGFWLLYEAGSKEYRFIDAREKAPAAAHRDYYLDTNGDVDRDRAINGPTAAGIPGQPAAFAWIAEKYGRLPLSKTLQAAIDQAADGFPVDDHYRALMGYRLDVMRRYPESASIFLMNSQIPETGYNLVQTDLATTLKALARDGKAGFYGGPVATKLVTAVQEAGGDWTEQDLKDYDVVERDPIRITLGDTEYVGAPPPSSGGIAIAQMLKMLQHSDWKTLNDADQTHLLTEVMRRAYRDRAEWLGDPDFVDVPVSTLLSDERAAFWADSIDMETATPSLSLNGPANIEEGFHTTHLSVVDAEGNRVAATLSINLPFGSGFTAAGTGVLLNNEMDDFSAKPGEPNAYGLVGDESNAIAPGKRPLSSMSPSMLESPDSIAVLGTPGGSRIISMVFLGTLEYLQGKPVEDWVSRPRFHHQYLPDVIQYESGALSPELITELESRGHEFRNVGREYGNMQAILINKKTGRLTAASDPRGIGEASVAQGK